MQCSSQINGDAPMAKKPSDQVKLNLRFTEALRARLEKQATKNQRSLNEEIIRRLEGSFKGDDFQELLERWAQETGRPVTLKVGDTTKTFQPREGDGK
jgi:Arc-like DNA binding domain